MDKEMDKTNDKLNIFAIESDRDERCLLNIKPEYYLIRQQGSQVSGFLSLSPFKSKIGIRKRVKANRDKRSFVDRKISILFMTIGIPVHVTGYHYLREAVKLAAGNFEMISCITTKLYPAIAVHFNASPCMVERGIRNAIDVAWNKGRLINLNAVFGIEIFENSYKPSSGELIALLAEKLYLDELKY